MFYYVHFFNAFYINIMLIFKNSDLHYYFCKIAIFIKSRNWIFPFQA